MNPFRLLVCWWAALRLAHPTVLLLALGCGQPRNEVVVYCALDREFAEPILAEFQQDTGIKVRAKYDAESTKTVGLAELLLREKANPRCDLFWNNELLHSVRLAGDGVFEAYESPVGKEYPERYRSPEGLWYGFAARARVLLVNVKNVDAAAIPTRLEDLTLPRWRGKVGIAKPLFGTTATQFAVLFDVWGQERATAWIEKLKANDVQILSGNKQVAVKVGEGSIDLGLTDTDDALAEIRAKRPVRMTFVESGPDGMGLLLIPNALSVVRGAPNAAAARRLCDYLLSPATEAKLALGESGQLPLHPKTAAAPGWGLPADAKRAEIDFGRAAGAWKTASQAGAQRVLHTVKTRQIPGKNV